MSEKKAASAAPAVPQANPLGGYLARKDEIDAAIARALAGNRYILGPEVEAFEQEFAAYIGAAHGVGVANGTDAIELALRAFDLDRNDLVFTVSQTAVATVSAIERAGATPVLVDIDPVTYTMDPERLEAAVAMTTTDARFRGMRPRVVVPVHLYGHPADLPAIMEIAARAGMRVIEDCAQAHGAALHGRKLGTWGDLAAYSLYPTKNLAAIGDGGIITGNDRKAIERIRALRQYGWEERYISSIRGFNSRLDELQAAILRVRLRHLDADNDRRRRVAKRYDTMLADAGLTLPTAKAGAHHVYHQYVVRTTERDSLREQLAQDGVGTAIHYPMPIHQQPAYAGRIAAGPLDVTETAAREIASLPMFPELTDDQVQRVVRAVKSWAASVPAA